MALSRWLVSKKVSDEEEEGKYRQMGVQNVSIQSRVVGHLHVSGCGLGPENNKIIKALKQTCESFQNDMVKFMIEIIGKPKGGSLSLAGDGGA